MKIYCISWKDERWSADKESLKAINKLISKEKTKMNKVQKNSRDIIYIFRLDIDCTKIYYRYTQIQI